MNLRSVNLMLFGCGILLAGDQFVNGLAQAAGARFFLFALEIQTTYSFDQ